MKKHSCPCGFVFVFGEAPDHEIEAECPKCHKKHVIKPATPATTTPASGGEGGDK